MTTKVIIGGQIPEANNKPNECLFENKKVCSSPNEINLMKDYLKEYNLSNLINASTTDREIIDIIKNTLGVNSEAAIWENKQFKEFVGESKARSVLRNIFKPAGPNDSTALLDNYNIDETLEQWSKNSQTLFKKKFYHIPFQMIDFDKVGSELSYTKISDIIKKGFNCFGVVLNTDVTSGRGKHWFCLYGDLQHEGTESDPYTLEYFNSSGNPPVDEVEIWMQKAVHDLMRDSKKTCVIIRSAPRRLQYSRTECGVFSLMYIKSRLEGHPYDWFYKVEADDNDMVQLRKHLFRKKL